ncbi:glycosyltransferase family 2 protein [Kordiimonas aestuarii]|uniref:glycosyltransferase family 2 protein n=1 Tax=Kordiimonas aestuarii TaxID=1005925 RepID=UPI0021CF9C15|nr:glycosyltransferase family 2 protein [Kordiimonas aestuarii]
MARVTIVIATYNRPHLLNHTIQSILHQTVKDWLLLVIGDACAPETEKMMEGFNDERIFYLNLQTRCGEQSGPNTAGLYAAETEFVAFVNHDDIWLPDHLERAIETMDRQEVDFYAAGAALTTLNNHDNKPICWEQTPSSRTARDAFFNMPVLFEPVSAWVVRRSALETVGPWKPARQIYRTPLEDWVLRAWRSDIKCHFDDHMSVIYCNAEKTAWFRKSPEEQLYGLNDSEGGYWLARIQKLGTDKTRELLHREVATCEPHRNWSFFKYQYAAEEHSWVYESLITEETAELYKTFGWDGHAQASAMLRGKPGDAMASMLKRRTGEELPTHENWQLVAREAKERLQTSPRWRKMNDHA